MSDLCSCGRLLLTVPGDLEPTCARCHSLPSYCECAPDRWERPSPLGGHGSLPGFPVAALPDWAAAEVGALAVFTQTPPDLGATVLLAVLSAAAGGRAVVEVRGSWREPVNLYAVAAMPSGARKSAVFAELTGPLMETEHALVEKTRPAILENETQRRVAQRDAERAAMAASGLDNDDARKEAMANAIAAAQLAEAITVPVMPRLIADDVTPEASATLLAEQGGRLAVLSAEGGIFSMLAGRYSGGVPSLEVFLKGHSGDMLRVDRKGRPPEHIAQPALTLGLCVQPEVLRTIAGMPGFRARGLLARILYSLPPNLVGHREIGTPPVPEDIRDAYASSVQNARPHHGRMDRPGRPAAHARRRRRWSSTPSAASSRGSTRTPATSPGSSTGPASRSARPSA